jgi:hypothetical protein
MAAVMLNGQRDPRIGGRCGMAANNTCIARHVAECCVFVYAAIGFENLFR